MGHTARTILLFVTLLAAHVAEGMAGPLLGWRAPAGAVAAVLVVLAVATGLDWTAGRRPRLALLFVYAVSIPVAVFIAVRFGRGFAAVLALVALSAGRFIPGLVYGLREGERQRRLAEGLCPSCGYDLTGNVSGVCPECGA